MSNYAPLGVLLLLIAGCSDRTGVDVAGKVLNYGILTYSEEKAVEDSTMPSGKRWRGQDPTFIVRTNRVPARIGLHFGAQFEINNLSLKDGENVTVTVIHRHPPIPLQNGVMSTIHERLGTRPVKNGRAVGTAGWYFERESELVPGQWEFSLAYEGRTLCVQQFTVFSGQDVKSN
jgi:hypothetical protein